MAQREEQIKVGALAVVTAILFLTALVFVGGVNLLRKKKVTYTTFFKFAGGLEPGSAVRFGGLKVGAVQDAQIDPQDSTRVRVKLLIAQGTPIRANSHARISSLGFLGENYVEVSPGTRDAAKLPPGSEIPAEEIVQLADVFNNVNNITVNANKLVGDLDEKFLALSDNANRLITNLNAVVGPENRQHLEAALANIDALLAEDRPRLKSTLANLDSASAKLAPALASAHKTLDHSDTLVTHLDSVIQEDRQVLHETLARLKETLGDARHLIADLDDTLTANRRNLDETLANVRVATRNLRQFTDTIKKRPFSLVRVKAQPDRNPPGGK